MQKLSLKVLLRFLSSYSHWNLVRRNDCYHLYFVTQESTPSTISAFPSPSKCRKKGEKFRRKGSKLTQHIREVVPLSRRHQRPRRPVTPSLPKVPGPSQPKKDLFVISPIFESAEQAVEVGLAPLQQTVEQERSRKTSLNSLVWDDFLPPYKEDSEWEEDKDDASFETVGTNTDTSREVTPTPSEGGSLVKPPLDRYYESSMRAQGDRLLRDMLQLRRDIEEDLRDTKEEEKEVVEDREVTEGRKSKEESENILRERLELMTLQIKKEMSEELLKSKSNLEEGESGACGTDSNATMKSFFSNLVSDDSDIKIEIQNDKDTIEDSIVADENSGDKYHRDELKLVKPTCIENISEGEKGKETTIALGGKQNIKENVALGNEGQERHIKKPQNSTRDSPEILGEKKKEKTLNTNVPDRAKSKKENSKDNVDTSKKANKKLKTPNPEVKVEIPFCSHNQHSTGQDLTGLPPTIPLARQKVEKLENTTLLSRDDQMGAEEILSELLEIRDGKQKAGKDPVLDTMISIIQLASTNVSLPTQANSSSEIQFKELFDFEVNFSESREAFAKLAMNKGDSSKSGKHTAQELFPWSRGEETVFRKLRGSLAS